MRSRIELSAERRMRWSAPRDSVGIVLALPTPHASSDPGSRNRAGAARGPRRDEPTGSIETLLRWGTATLVLATASVAIAAGSAEGAVGLGPNQQPTASALSGATQCPRSYSGEYGAIYWSDLSVRRISCRAARRLLNAVPVSANARPRGYRCRAVGTVYEGATYRCTKGRRTMQFNAGV